MSRSIPDLIKKRLSPDRVMTTITLRIPEDIVESMKLIAPQRGFSGYQALLKAYISEGLRRDEAEFMLSREARLKEALRKQGVSAEIIKAAEAEIAHG